VQVEHPRLPVISGVSAYWEAAARLDTLIETAPEQMDTSRPAVQARAEVRMARLRRFLDQVGYPLAGMPIVHVGGTSGKGSTSTAIASMLAAAGYRTGLHTSPYLQVPSEKIQIDGRLISPERFIALTERVLDAHTQWMAKGELQLTYGEVWIALMALAFRDAEVDVAVIEVGAGGRFDLTNVVTPVLSVVTSVGIDHTATLGPTIADIAWHKAGIVKPGIPAISAVAHPEAARIVRTEAETVGAPFTWVDTATRVTGIEVGERSTSWRDAASGEVFEIGLAGSFQAVNGMVAVEAVRTLSEVGFEIDEAAIRRGLMAAAIPGRAEIMPGTPQVLLDGAHNDDKVAALVADLDRLLPVAGRRIAVVGALESKTAESMLGSLLPHVDVVITTSPKVLAKAGREADALAETARSLGHPVEVMSEPSPADAVSRAIAMAGADDAVLVTGSLYLVGNVRERWFHADDIIKTGTPWPG
jgi:dihydrofolate synthase/folylpolyglutamate synthase